MIYIIKKQDNIVLTDSWLNYIPELLNVYVDDVLIGEFINNSLVNNYISVTIPKEDLDALQLVEGKLKWFSNGILLKEELVSIKSTNSFEINSITNNTITYYE